MNPQTQTLITQQIELPLFSTLRRVLIIGPHNLLDQAVARLLSIRSNLDVIQADDTNLIDLAWEVAQIHPDVIVLCHIEPDLQNSFIQMLDCNPAIEDLSIIIVHPLNNKLEIFHRHQWFSADHIEFFSLVYGKNPGTLRQLVYKAA